MKNFVKWALIIVIINIVVAIVGYVAGGFDPNTGEQSMIARILGWIGMIAGLVCLFLGIKEKKDSDPADFTFGRGWVEGFLITVVGSVLVAIWTYVFFSFIASDQIEIVYSVTLKNMAAQGMTPDKIDQAKPWMDFMFSPTGFAMWGFFAYLVIGMILSLIVSAVVNAMNKRGGEPATAA
jgi:uncharacterized membrane protein YtjA (UPF0391 family)